MRRGNGEVESLRERLKAALIHQVLDQLGGGHDEAEVAAQALPEAGHEQQLPILFVEEHRGRGLRGAEALERFEQRLRPVPGIGPIEHHAGEARIAGRLTRRSRDGARDARDTQRTEQVRVAEYARESGHE